MTRRLVTWIALAIPVVVICHLVGVAWPWSPLFCFVGGVVMGYWWSWRGR